MGSITGPGYHQLAPLQVHNLPPPLPSDLCTYDNSSRSVNAVRILPHVGGVACIPVARSNKGNIEGCKETNITGSQPIRKEKCEVFESESDGVISDRMVSRWTLDNS